MIFATSDRTAFDLNFRLFGVDVRVSPWFWAVSAILGWSSMALGFSYVVLWVACVFVSILLHEMGHVLVGRMFGSHGHILLFGFGGLAIGSSALPKRWQRIAVYLAGPGIQFLLAGALFVAFLGIDKRELSLLTLVAYSDLLLINIFWPVLNLMPVFPLDGGQVSREICQSISPRNGLRISLILSIIAALALAIGSFIYLGGRSFYTPLMFGLLALNSYQALQQIPRMERWDSGPGAWERDREQDRW